MPRAFDITPATPSVRLDASGQGEFSFTVSNALRRPVRARITLIPEGQTRREWLSVAGEAERDFAADGTQQVTAKVSVPAGTAPGTYACHPVVATVNNPDEEYADGPTVSFEVAASTPPRKAFPFWIIAVVAGVLVLGAVLFLLLRPKGPTLHDPCDPAQANACGAALTCSTTERECLINTGDPCRASADCLTGRCEDSRCAAPPPGAACSRNEDCPPTQKCAEVRPGVKACLLRPGQPCTADLQCSSIFCAPATRKCSRDDGRCTAETANQDCNPAITECKNGACVLRVGQPCHRDEQCTTGRCVGTCQPPIACVPPCTAFQRCVNGRCFFIPFEPVDPRVRLRLRPHPPEEIERALPGFNR